MSTPSPQSRLGRPLLIGLGIVGVAALAYLVITQLGGSDVADDAAGPAPVSSEAGVATEPATDATEVPTDATEAPSEVAVVEPTFEVFDARDPFEQLVAADTGGGSDTVGTTEPTATSPVVDGSQSTGTTPTGGDPAQTTVGGATILLEDVFTLDGQPSALVVINGEGYEATAGQTVAGDVTVLDIAGNCATMRYEDRRFILCEGEQVQK